jgi:hydroxymethylbilane synthase
MNDRIWRIATRKSALALWQANHVADCLRRLPSGPAVELVLIVTSGDQNQTDALRQFGGTGVFTREVQKAVLDGRADFAVHSLKDLPTQSVDGLSLACVPERAPAVTSLDELPASARIGTGSPRRQAQLRYHRGDLEISEIRGNVDTRLRKLDEGEYDAILLAEAGLRRLGLQQRISFLLQPPLFFPAVSQGALGIEARTDDTESQSLLSPLTCVTTHAEVIAERALLRTLRAGCHAPLGVWAEITDHTLTLTAVLLSQDGTARLEQSASGSVDDPERIGVSVAEKLFAAGASVLLGE